MSKITKREMQKIISRLEFIYNQLDGKKKAGPIASSDEFTNLQNHISEEIVALRNKIQQKKRLEKSRDNFLEVTKLKQQINGQVADLEGSFGKLRFLLQKIQDSKQIPSKVKESRAQIVAKFEKIIDQVKRSVNDDAVTEEEPLRQRNVLKLADVKKNPAYGLGRKEMEFKVDETDEERDDDAIAEWKARDAKMDDKLDDINLLLGEIKMMSDNLGREIDNRNEMVNMANKDAAQANQALQVENDRLNEVLKKYRAPSKICLDICLCLLLLGLIAVVIMLIKNGK